MRTAIALVLGLVAASLIGTTTATTTAWAQTQPEPFAWERKTNMLLHPKRIDRLSRAQRVLNRDSRKLGRAVNRIFGPAAEAAAVTPSPTGSSGPARHGRHGRLDSNRDGFISRGEYLSGRSRPARAGTHGRARHVSRRARLHSRFRAADRNRDGKLSTDELQSLRNHRF